MAGYTDGLDTLPSDLTQPPLEIIPGGTVDSPLDSIQFFQNVPIQECRLAGPVSAGATSISLSSPGSATLDFARGDWFVLRDGSRTEYGFFASAAGEGGVVSVMDQASYQSLSASSNMANGAGMMNFAHATGASVMVMRPMQMIRYSIQNRNLDPADPSAVLPCLMRQQTDYVPSGTIDWTAVPFTLISENVTSLRVDMSVDGGVNWARGTATNWAGIKAAINGKLPTSNQLVDTEFWFKRIPVLFRVDLKSRTATARSEYSSNGKSLAFKEKAMVLMIVPRNFALPNI
jgi:hypothetical protein